MLKKAISRMKQERLISLLILIVLVKGIVLIVLIPPFQTPDEPNHYDHALYLSKADLLGYFLGKHPISGIENGVTVTHELKTLLSLTQFQDIPFHYDEKIKIGLRNLIQRTQTFKDQDTSSSLSGKKLLSRAFNYPPLYYVYESLPLRMADVFHLNIVIKFLLARFFSLLLFMTSLVFAYKSLRIIKFSRFVIVIIFTFIALQPQLSMLSVSVQPDILALLLINVCLYFSLKFINEKKWKDFYFFHIGSGLLLLTKIQFFFTTYPILFLLICLFLLKNKGIDKKLFLHSLIGLGILSIIGGWWYLRSYLLFDNFMGYISFEEAETSFFNNLFYWIFQRGRLIFKSFWGVWGWLDYAYPLVLFFFFFILTIVPFPFWMKYLFTQFKKVKLRLFRGQSSEENRIRNILFTLAPLFCYFLVMIYIAGTESKETNDQGRHWMPFILPIAIYLGGFYEFIRFRSTRMGFLLKRLNNQVLSSIHIILFLLLNIYMMYLTYLRYYPVS